MRLTLQATVFNKFLSFKNEYLSFFRNQLSLYINHLSEAFNFLISILLMKVIRNFITLNLQTGLSMMCVLSITFKCQINRIQIIVLFEITLSKWDWVIYVKNLSFLPIFPIKTTDLLNILFQDYN